MAICKYCKHVNEDGIRFCQICGKTLDVFPDPAMQAANPAPSNGTQGFPPVPNSTPSVPMPVPTQIPNPQGSYQQAPVNEQPGMAKEGPTSKKFEPANTFPMNDKDRQAYAEKLANPYRNDHDTLCVLALVFGMLSFIFNPLLITSLLAIILGIIGNIIGGPKKRIARLGWILGLISLIIYLIIIIIIAIAAYTATRILFWWMFW